ncbi:hypothetical protein CYY_007273 [Polysphondylium violaceum]|uniref:TOG domain-containing protein n=1 Tax=Polysphondylium violaceum TaxID=133409 RepID=A0A8J4PPU9_9MYCE|nr:hypothetical protein CYY_007273 [Polysphondylium violaceum]
MGTNNNSNNNSYNYQMATSIISKIKSKEFKERLSGYDDMLTLFNSISDPDAPEFSRLANAFEKIMIVDTQPNNRERALQVLLVFLERSNYAFASTTPTSFSSDLVRAIIDNCFTSQRDTTKLKAVDCILMLNEVVGPTSIVPILLEFMINNKAPKIIVSCAYTLKELIRQFGSFNLPVETIIKNTLVLFDHQLKDVRTEAMGISLELYKWLGDNIAPQFKQLRPAQLKEFETSIQSFKSQQQNQQKVSSSPSTLTESQQQPLRVSRGKGMMDNSSLTNSTSNILTKSQPVPVTLSPPLKAVNDQHSPPQPSPTSRSSSPTIGSAGISSSPSSFESSPLTTTTIVTSSPPPPPPTISSSTTPIENQQQQQQIETIQSKLQEFYKLSEDSNWSTRKQALTDIFIPLISNKTISKLTEHDYSKISNTLAKLLGDVNIFVILTCINALELLVKKLPRDLFFNHIIALVPIMLDSFKEKRPQLSDSIHACLNTIMEKQLKINEVLDFIIEILLNSKISKLKYEVMLWFRRLLLSSSLSSFKKDIPLIVGALAMSSEDQCKENRDICLLNLSTIALMIGERELFPLLLHLDEEKQNQLRELIKEASSIHSHWSKGKKTDFPTSPSSTKFKQNILTEKYIFNSPSSSSSSNLSNNSPMTPNFQPIKDNNLINNNINNNNNNNNNNINQNNNNIQINNVNVTRETIHSSVKEIQDEFERYTSNLSNKMKSLDDQMKRFNDQQQSSSQNNNNNNNNNTEQGNNPDQQRFYETLNQELSKELQSEKEKKHMLLEKLQDYDKQMNDLISAFKILSQENKTLKFKTDQMNEILSNDREIKEKLINEIQKLKESQQLNMSESNVNVNSNNINSNSDVFMISTDPSRYLVELPVAIVDQLPDEELELFQEVYQENLRIIEQARNKRNN